MNQGKFRAVLGHLHRVANLDGGGPDDSQILDRWREQRDPAAFEVLVWRHGSMVWNVCRRILSHEQDVEDAFQATFLTFLRKARTIGEGRFLGSWLYKVAYRTALATGAVSDRHTVHSELNGDLPVAVNDDAWDQLRPVLDEEVNRLPEKYRRPFVLCYLEGKSTDEAAKDLGCPRGTVGTRLAWARERLRSRLTRRGVTLSVAGLATLLAEKATAATVPMPLVLTTVKAATLGTAAKAVAAGVLSARTATLTQGVLHAMFVSKVKTIAALLFVVGVLGSGVERLTHHALAGRANNEIGRQGESETRKNANEPPFLVSWPPPLPFTLSPSDPEDEDQPAVINDDKTPIAQGRDEKAADSLQFAGIVTWLTEDGKKFGLEVPSKPNGATKKVDIIISDKTLLLFSNVGPNEARLTAGYRAFVWLKKGSKDVASRVQLSGRSNAKNAPQRVGKLVAAADGDKGITLAKTDKGEPAEKISIKFTDQTRVSFSNVLRGGATLTAGYEGQVWLENGSQDTAKLVMFCGTAEPKPAENKILADRSGRVVGLSGDGQVLTVEILPTKVENPTITQIKLTDATTESYHGVAANGAKPVVGYLVQAWLVDGSQDTAARVRFARDDPRQSVDGKIIAVATDRGRITVEFPTQVTNGQFIKREIQIAASTKLVFANVGPDGAQLTEGYHIRGWLAEGSNDTADELMVSRVGK